MSEQPHRCGFVAIVGRPNVGKSTLMNRLVGQKVSITSRKAQTTRHRINGILTRPDAQFVFVDTPGFQTSFGGALNRVLNHNVTDSLGSVDVVVLVVEAGRFSEHDAAVLRLAPEQQPLVLAINKIDRLADKAALLPFIERVRGKRDFAAVVPLSAQTGMQCDALLDTLAGLLPEGASMFDDDQITDRSERFLAAEIVREKIFRQTGEEIPYGTNVTVETFETEGDMRRIGCLIVVARASHKPMIIGARGARLKTIATEARMDMEHLFGGKVFLELWVKVDENWSDDPKALRKYGYG